MPQGPSGKKLANGLVAAGAAAVMAVYAAGYSKTQSAADKFDAQSAGRRLPPAAATPAAIAERAAPAQIASIERPAQSATPARAAAPTAKVSESPKPVVPTAAAEPAAQPAPVETAPTPAPVAMASVVPPAAAVVPPAPVAAPAPVVESAAKWKDGTYLGWGTCRHGDIQAQVIIEAGKITKASIAQCLTRYSCDIIGRLPPEVIQRQSAEVDYVSGATQSANAFYYALLDALSKAK
jgi:uncharacterized protein with FMN-binding domain